MAANQANVSSSAFLQRKSTQCLRNTTINANNMDDARISSRVTPFLSRRGNAFPFMHFSKRADHR